MSEKVEARDDVIWEYRSPIGDRVIVRYRDGHWYNAASPVSPYYRDDRIPTWPGTFTVIGSVHKLNPA